ncbi:MAG: DUF5011 domain-containing protein, partial [Actinobacteria bacterium]|nr:DUF5011 domain-containing protein [Actinomycetota bacterium]
MTRTVNVVLDPSADEDGDGLTNGAELSGGTNPYQKDSDGDGVNDPVELADGTNPSDANSYNNLNKGLVAYYPFNGNLNDESGGGNHLSNRGTSLTHNKEGSAERALRIQPGQYVIDPDMSFRLSGAGDYTFSLWYRAENLLNTYGMIFTLDSEADGHGYADYSSLRFSLSTNRDYLQRFNFSVGAGSDNAYFLPEFSPPLGQWMHLAVTVTSAGEVRQYVNGSLLNTGMHAITSTETVPTTLKLGHWYYDFYADQSLDECRIYNRALNLEEIRTLYVLQGGSGDFDPPLITLIGADPLEIYKGATFTDPGATVTDNVDAVRTITGSGTVDASTVGIYTLTYTTTDAAGNLALPVTRTVNVVSVPSPGQYQLDITNLTPELGSVTGAGLYSSGSTATLTAYPNPGYVIDWDNLWQDLVQNGSFEEPGFGGSGTTFNTVHGTFNHWNWHFIDYFRYPALAVDGIYFADLNRNPGDNNFVEQTLTGLSVGKEYEVGFMVWLDTSAAGSSVRCSVGTHEQNFLIPATEVWTARTMRFTAQETSMLLRIMALTASRSADGTFLDKVTVVEVLPDERTRSYAMDGPRTVTVKFVPLLQSSSDTQAPVITLIGSNPLEIYKDSAFTDPGATVTDNKDATRSITG